MKLTKLRSATIAAAIVAVGAGGVASISAAAPDADKAGGNTTKITMEAQGKKLFFSGPKRVEKGTKLKIVNKTNPGKVGPHTFTLIKKNRLPDTKKEEKDCEKIELAVCVNAFKAHEVDPMTFEVSRPKVEVGRKGWDKSFGRTGDSWFTDAAGAHNTRKASANDGKTLYYFCLVHPSMQGKIKVVK